MKRKRYDDEEEDEDLVPPVQAPKRGIPAFAYLRVSGKSQIDGDGFTRQREAIATYAEAAGLEIVHEYEEQAISGTTEWDSRPAWMEMMLAIAGNGVETIIIEKLDRLARDLLVQEHIIADLRKRGVTLISVAEPDLCTDDPSRKLLRQIMGAIAEYDRAMIVLKLRGARKRMKAATGRCEGRKPFGYQPKEAAALGVILASHDAGMTRKQIAAYLNEKGISTRSGEPWRETVVGKILRRQREVVVSG